MTSATSATIAVALLALAVPCAAPAETGSTAKVSVNAGPIWSRADAARKCPAVASAYGGSWDGQWRTIQPKVMAACEIEYVATPVATKFIANAGAADAQCAAAAKAHGGMWNGRWQTTAPGSASACDLRLPLAKPENENWLIGTWNGEVSGVPFASVFTAGTFEGAGPPVKASYDVRGDTVVVSYVDDDGNRARDTYTKIDATHASGTYPDGKTHTYAIAASSIPPSPVAGVDFKNFDYAVSPCGGGPEGDDDVPPPVRVRNGTYAYNNAKMGTAFDVAVSYVQRGSLKPGTQQALVVLSCHFPIGGTSTAYVYDVGGTSAALLGIVAGAGWGGDWGSGPASIHTRFANGFLYVDACARASDCKTRIVTTYALRNGILVEVRKQNRVALRLRRASNDF